MSVLARLRGNRFALISLLLLVLVATGIALYLDERDTRQQTRELAVPTAADWVELDITTQDIQPSAGQVTLYLSPVPHGSLAVAPDSFAFSRAVDIKAESTGTASLHANPGEAATPQIVQAGLYGGTETDYPFDRAKLSIAFSATEAGRSVPVGLVFADADPFFFVRPTGTVLPSGATLMDAKVTRARSTFILAWFMIVAMWALALAVMTGAEVLYRAGQGLVWPSLGWMAATLFALIGMRNAAPGSPPIGSLLDYIAFFWAEAIIAASLTVTVITGFRAERRKRAEADGSSAARE